MKKFFFITIATLAPVALFAQEYYRLPDNRQMSSQLISIPATIFVMYLVGAFILHIIRTALDHRLRSKLVDKGVTDKVAGQFLQPAGRDLRSQALKWCLMLTGTGIGLTAVYYTLPLDIHSLAIMAFSIALSYLAYFLYLKYTEQP
jgi:hypothetical protein